MSTASIQTPSEPPNYTRFLNGNELNLEAVKKEPHKALKLFVLAKNQIPSITPAILENLKRQLLLQSSTFSSYHFVKFICHHPELLIGREQEFVEKSTNFSDELTIDQKPKMLARAGKISRLISKNETLQKAIGTLICKSFPIGENATFEMDRFLWAEKVKAWRPMLLGKWNQHNPIGASKRMLETIDQFIKSGTLPKLTVEQLFKLRAKARELDYEDLEKICISTLCHELPNISINGENLLEIFNFGLRHHQISLINKCIDFIHRTKKGIFLQWDPINGLELRIRDLNEINKVILSGISPHIRSVIFLTPNIVKKVVNEKFTFPSTYSFNIPKGTESKLIPFLGKIFPKAKKCILQRVVYEQLVNERPIKELPCIEILHVTEGRTPLSTHAIFPNLKLCMVDPLPSCNQFSWEVDPINKILLCSLGKLTEGLLHFNRLHKYPPAPAPALLVSDTIVIELLHHYSSELKRLDLSNCSKITDLTILALARCKISLTDLFLNHCSHLTDEIAPVLTALPLLRNLSLKNCSQLTDKTGASVTTLKDLEDLDLEKCNKMSREMGMKIVDSLTRLRRLNMSDWNLLHDTDIVKLINHRSFRYLKLADCAGLTETLKNDLRENQSRYAHVNVE